MYIDVKDGKNYDYDLVDVDEVDFILGVLPQELRKVYSSGEFIDNVHADAGHWRDLEFSIEELEILRGKYPKWFKKKDTL
jgi:hypothetical protein